MKNRAKSCNPDKQNKTWSKKNENTFISHRQRVKRRFFNQAQSISWNELGIQPFVQKESRKFRTKQNRETIFKRFQEKEPVTDEEIRYLANTSSILNAVVDKQFYNQAISLIDRETLENVNFFQWINEFKMEMGIVEDILEKYKNTRNNIFQARIGYLSK